MVKRAFQVARDGTGVLVMNLDDATYDTTIGPIVGITPLTGPPPAGSFSETSVNGVRKGLLGSVRISYKVGTKRKSSKLLCSLEKIDTCTAELPGKAFKTGTITGARFPTRRRLR
ncbi:MULTISPECIES: hypothetical protein [unclassified Microcoleus]|uniref:hypothetical protein n=1 Tax=unclassified Microcoleus TaxID=2642155 RepID=UPI002FD4C872